MNNFIDTQIDFHAIDHFMGCRLEVNVNFPAMLSWRTFQGVGTHVPVRTLLQSLASSPKHPQF